MQKKLNDSHVVYFVLENLFQILSFTSFFSFKMSESILKYFKKSTEKPHVEIIPDFTLEPEIYSYKDDGLFVEFYSNFISKEYAESLFTTLELNTKWSANITPGRRVNCTYGDDGLVYSIDFMGKTTYRKTKSWDPLLYPLREKLQTITSEKYNICVVQRYPNGSVGINPHRDKEMTPGTTICGVSLGETRTLTLRNSKRKIELCLKPGSLYILHPPTNDYFAHSIEKDSTVKPRISLTFRNYNSIYTR